MRVQMRHSASPQHSPASMVNRQCVIAIASRIPGARKGTVEIRPIVELSGLPVEP